MAVPYVSLKHKMYGDTNVKPNHKISFDGISTGGCIQSDGTIHTIKENGVYIVHFHLPVTFTSPHTGLDDEHENILISLFSSKQGIIGTAATNVDEDSSDGSDGGNHPEEHEYAEMVSGTYIFTAKKGEKLSLVNHSKAPINVLLLDNSATSRCSAVCGGASATLYKIGDYNPCYNPCDDEEDDDDEMHGCCND